MDLAKQLDVNDEFGQVQFKSRGISIILQKLFIALLIQKTKQQAIVDIRNEILMKEIKNFEVQPRIVTRVTITDLLYTPTRRTIEKQ